MIIHNTAYHIREWLEQCNKNNPKRGITFHSRSEPLKPIKLSYSELVASAKQNANKLRAVDGVSAGKIVLVHFSTHFDSIVWFWTVIFAGCIPAMSTPLVNDSEGRRSHLEHLQSLLFDPLCVTTTDLLQKDFSDDDVLRVVAVEALDEINPEERGHSTCESDGCTFQHFDDLAVLMLTSGSTGSAKAVSLTHQQLRASVYGKLAAISLSDDAVLLNWVALDHVASLVEIHLCAVFAGLDQIHVDASNVVSDPLYFLRLLSQHRVSRTFAPNFFLCKLLGALEGADPLEYKDLDLEPLVAICSGGEANDVNVCSQVCDRLLSLGAQNRNIVVPGFGMTETCAGAIFNLKCPDDDKVKGNEFAGLGQCIPGIEMRISPIPESEAMLDRSSTSMQGALEVRGPIVFKEYFNNHDATQAAFTDDGWFKTGDNAMVTSDGCLHLLGRSKELININGVKYIPHELEMAIEQAKVPGIVPSYLACFAHRPSSSSTEEVFVIYEYSYDTGHIEARFRALSDITRILMLFTGSRPQVLPVSTGTLSKTTLGKLSRAKIRSCLARGQYNDQQNLNVELLKLYRKLYYSPPQSEIERIVETVFRESLGSGDFDLGVETPILQTGVSSVDLIRLKSAIEKAFSIREIPMVTIMTNTTIRALAAEIARGRDLEFKADYNPVVTLQSSGEKVPLWLIHPGIGEILVFLGLVPFFPDRPLHTLRARGFNPAEPEFVDLADVVTTYCQAIKTVQPKGPYALAGYSYGSMLAFEITKVFEASRDVVQFLGSFNLPPHIRERMRLLDWTAGLQHIAHFCGIITEQRSEELTAGLRPLAKSEQVEQLLAESDAMRCAELGLTHSALLNWVDVAFALQKIGWEYEPRGSVKAMDVFYCQPLKIVAKTREEYRTKKLDKWKDFVRGDVRFHEVDGEHYTMIGPDHVFAFQRTLQKALCSRGL